MSKRKRSILCPFNRPRTLFIASMRKRRPGILSSAAKTAQFYHSIGLWLIALYLFLQARKLAKKRLGTLKRAKGKVEELTNIIAEQRRSAYLSQTTGLSSANASIQSWSLVPDCRAWLSGSVVWLDRVALAYYRTALLLLF